MGSPKLIYIFRTPRDNAISKYLVLAVQNAGPYWPRPPNLARQVWIATGDDRTEATDFGQPTAATTRRRVSVLP